MKPESKAEKVEDLKQPVLDMFQQAWKNSEQVLEAGAKAQGEAVRWWNTVAQQGTLGSDWQKSLNTVLAMANEMLPATQKQATELLKLMEMNARTGAELMKKAVEAAQTPALAGSQAKWVDFWASSLGVMRSNTEALAQLNASAIKSWVGCVQRQRG